MEIMDTENRELLEAFANLNPMTTQKDLFMQAGMVFSGGNSACSRESVYKERLEMYSDPFTHSIVETIVGRAIGTSINGSRTISLSIANSEISDEVRKEFNEELDKLAELIDEVVIEMAKDAQFFGDGYCRVVVKEGKGVEKLLTNVSTKPFAITPIMSNFGTTVAYETANPQKVLGASRKTSRYGRSYIIPMYVGRISAIPNGTSTATTDLVSNINKHNLFDEKLHLFEDSIYGGMMESMYEDYRQFKWSVKSLVNARIASGITERFLMLNLKNVAKDDQKDIKMALARTLENSVNNMKQRTSGTNPTPSIVNHIIPVVGDNDTQGLNIQESQPIGQNANIDDIMFNLKKYLGALGFDIGMTSFGDNAKGGNEKDGTVQQSILMEAKATAIRKSIKKFVLGIVQTHFLAKYDTLINTNEIKVSFEAVLNHNKILAEEQRMEALTNSQQLVGVIEGLKGLGLEDNEDTRTFLRSHLEPLVSLNSDHKDIQLGVMIDLILKKGEEQNNE